MVVLIYGRRPHVEKLETSPRWAEASPGAFIEDQERYEAGIRWLCPCALANTTKDGNG